jgi:hypothetical protein
MKIYLALIVVFLSMAFSFPSKAQVMQAKAQWATISVPQLKCTACKKILEHYLLQEKGPNNDGGIVKWTTNLKTATLRIFYIPDRITLDYIRISIANAGFDADTVTANEESYNELPPYCKRDGVCKDKPY